MGYYQSPSLFQSADGRVAGSAFSPGFFGFMFDNYGYYLGEDSGGMMQGPAWAQPPSMPSQEWLSGAGQVTVYSGSNNTMGSNYNNDYSGVFDPFDFNGVNRGAYPFGANFRQYQGTPSPYMAGGGYQQSYPNYGGGLFRV